MYWWNLFELSLTRNTDVLNVGVFPSFRNPGIKKKKKKSVITPHKFSLDDVQKKLIENAGVTVGRNILITDIP